MSDPCPGCMALAERIATLERQVELAMQHLPDRVTRRKANPHRCRWLTVNKDGDINPRKGPTMRVFIPGCYGTLHWDGVESDRSWTDRCTCPRTTPDD
jgi:hypothetical protein